MVTAYETIAADLRADLLAGVYKVGDTLPSRQELCSRFGVAPMTIRNALSVLTGEGLIVLYQGKPASVVAMPEPERPPPPSVTASSLTLTAIDRRLRRIEGLLDEIMSRLPASP